MGGGTASVSLAFLSSDTRVTWAPLPPRCSERPRAGVGSPRTHTPGSLVPEAVSRWPPLVPRGEHKEDAPVPGLADNTQFLALGLPLFFFSFLPSSQVCSILSQGVAANSIASRFAAEGWEELRASLGLRAFVLGQ